MCKKCKAHIDNVAMLPLYGAILLMGVRTENLVSNAKLVEVWVQMLVFATLVRLNGNNLFIEPTLNKKLKLKENIEHNRFVS
jgi:hypothetical protein